METKDHSEMHELVTTIEQRGRERERQSGYPVRCFHCVVFAGMQITFISCATAIAAYSSSPCKYVHLMVNSKPVHTESRRGNTDTRIEYHVGYNGKKHTYSYIIGICFYFLPLFLRRPPDDAAQASAFDPDPPLPPPPEYFCFLFRNSVAKDDTYDLQQDRCKSLRILQLGIMALEWMVKFHFSFRQQDIHTCGEDPR